MNALTRLLALALLALPAAALDLGARDVLVPIAGRTAGANGSRWRTDLVITNVTRTPARTNIFLEFHATDGSTSWEAIALEPRQSLVLRDVLQNRFDRDQASGYIRVSTSLPTAQITARARIYNVGNPLGEFGQSVSGFPTDALTREHFVPALSGLGGNRTNLGITNPWTIEVKAIVELFDEHGFSKGIRNVSVASRNVLQINDVFAFFGTAPMEGASAKVMTNAPVYAWASVVRNDTGDATFIEGTGLAIGNERLAAPQCSAPAPVNLAAPGRESAGNWIVIYHAGTNAQAKTQELATRFGFAPEHVYEHGFAGFASALTSAQLASVRCDTAVMVIEENVVVPIP